jgi:predicted O-methyltransferase YrrM
MTLLELLNSLPVAKSKTCHLCQEENNYPLLADLLKILNPKSILEVGVWYGWSAVSFLYGAKEVQYYTGIDCQCNIEFSGDLPDNNQNNKAKENIEYFRKQTRKHFDFEVLNINTQNINNLDFLNCKHYDFIFIDADHHFIPCYKDLCNFWPVLNMNGNMMIDDSKDQEVRQAIDKFIFEINEPNYNIESSRNGNWVISKTK